MQKTVTKLLFIIIVYNYYLPRFDFQHDTQFDLQASPRMILEHGSSSKPWEYVYFWVNSKIKKKNYNRWLCFHHALVIYTMYCIHAYFLLDDLLVFSSCGLLEQNVCEDGRWPCMLEFISQYMLSIPLSSSKWVDIDKWLQSIRALLIFLKVICTQLTELQLQENKDGIITFTCHFRDTEHMSRVRNKWTEEKNPNQVTNFEPWI